MLKQVLIFLVVSGTEAGGHCGEISTLVVVPEVIETLRQHNMDVPVLAAGGIVTGKQMAACMMMGRGRCMVRICLANHNRGRNPSQH